MNRIGKCFSPVFLSLSLALSGKKSIAESKQQQRFICRCFFIHRTTFSICLQNLMLNTLDNLMMTVFIFIRLNSVSQVEKQCSMSCLGYFCSQRWWWSRCAFCVVVIVLIWCREIQFNSEHRDCNRAMAQSPVERTYR